MQEIAINGNSRVQRHVHDHGASQLPAESEGISEPGSFELSDDEVVALIQQLGFILADHCQAPGGNAGYVQDPTSMLQNVYRPSFWIAQLA